MFESLVLDSVKFSSGQNSSRQNIVEFFKLFVVVQLFCGHLLELRNANWLGFVFVFANFH